MLPLWLRGTAEMHPNRNLTARDLLAQKADETRTRKFQATVPDRHGEHVKMLPPYRKMPFPCVRTVVEGIAFEFLLFHFPWQVRMRDSKRTLEAYPISGVERYLRDFHTPRLRSCSVAFSAQPRFASGLAGLG